MSESQRKLDNSECNNKIFNYKTLKNMAKGNSNVRNKKSRSSKPYDVSNSFVSKVTSRVSNFLPRFTSWLTPHRPTTDVSSTDDEDDPEEFQAPPTKRARSELNQPLPAKVGENLVLRNVLEFENHEDQRSSFGFIDGRIAGPSGISQRPELVSSTPAAQLPPFVTNASQPVNQLINGDDHSQQSDSSVSTSGCSSLVPQAKYQAERKRYPSSNSRSVHRTSVGDRDGSSFLQTSRSVFTDTTYSPSPRPSSAQSKRPSFNASVFSNPLSPSLGSLPSERGPLSPFYTGRTQYGGAAAYRKPRGSLFSPSASPSPSARGVQMRPVNRTNATDLNSCTARRILDALDHLSSPVLDAKRIPAAVLPALDDSSSRKRPAPDTSPPTRASGPPTGALTIPTVSDLLRQQRRAKMQDSIEAARRVASTATATHLTDAEREYRRRLDSGQSRSTGKMTSRMRELEQEMCEEVDLPNVALPISTLPSFDFVASKPPARYSFSTPTALDSGEFVPPCRGGDNFMFVGSKLAFSNSAGNSSLSDRSKVNNAPNFIPYCPSKSDTTVSKPKLKEKSSFTEVTKNNGQNGKVNFGVGVAGDLKVGSVTDLSGKHDGQKAPASTLGDMFKPAAGSWECSACMVRNAGEVTACVSCTTPRPTNHAAGGPAAVATASTFGFGSQFKKPPGSWDCSDCMTSNKAEAASCVCCTKSKPVPKADVKPQTTVTGFGNQFKPAVGEWECATCMLRNKKDALSCVSCTTPKPGAKLAPATESASKPPITSGFGNQFKPPSNTWECPTCLLRTSNDLNTCSVCETKRPGVGMTNNLSKPMATPGFGDLFKKKEGSWDCPSCMIQNVNVDKCVACEESKPGSVVADKGLTLPASTIKFSFGIPPEASTFKFGVDKADVTPKKPEATPAPSFVFGSTPQVTSEAKTFMFGIPKTPATTTDGKVSGATGSKAVNDIPSSQAVMATSNPFALGTSVTPQVSTSSAGNAETTTGSSVGVRKRRVDDTEDEQPATKVAVSFSPKETPNAFSSAPEKTSVSSSTFTLPTTTAASAMKLNGPSTAVPTATSSAIPTTSAPSNLFAFGVYNSKPGMTFGSGSNNMFGTASTTKAPTPSLSFAEPTKPTQALFDFGSASAAKQNKAEVPAMQKPVFGSTIAQPAEGGFGGLVSSALSFPSAASLNASKTAAPSFGEGAAKIAPPSFSSTTASPSFGGFGSGGVTNTMSAPGPPASTPFLFGAGTSKPAVPVFGSGKEETFSFGSAATATPKAASFSFGSQSLTSNAAEPPKPSPGIFSFSAGSAPQKTTGSFGFGASSNGLGNNTSAPATFGTIAPNPSPVFGTPAPPPAFGGLPTAQGGSVGTGAGFSFGATSQTPATVFGFGVGSGSQPAVPAATGFAFGQTAPTTFNPNARPTFNFTGGETPNFTAAGAGNPSAAVHPRRLIKKAVRRTPR